MSGAVVLIGGEQALVPLVSLLLEASITQMILLFLRI